MDDGTPFFLPGVCEWKTNKTSKKRPCNEVRGKTKQLIQKIAHQRFGQKREEVQGLIAKIIAGGAASASAGGAAKSSGASSSPMKK